MYCSDDAPRIEERNVNELNKKHPENVVCSRPKPCAQHSVQTKT